MKNFLFEIVKKKETVLLLRQPLTYAELFTIKEHIRKDGANLTAILTVSKKNIGKLNGNIDLIKKYYGQT